MPYAVIAELKRAFSPAMDASAPAVTMGGMAVSKRETFTAGPDRSSSLQAKRKTRGVTIRRRARPASRGNSSSLGSSRRIWNPIATMTTGIRDVADMASRLSSQCG